MQEVARYDDYQLFHVILRARDQFGRLIRKMAGLPDWVECDEEGMRIVSKPKPFQVMFQQIGRRAGWSDKEIDNAWGKYKDMYPRMGRMDETDVKCDG